MSSQRPPGTAFKPLVYAAAFEKGLYPGTVVRDEVFENQKVMIGVTTGILGEWGPERPDNKYEGAISARTALVKSKNGATVRLGMMTGLEKVIPLAKDAGIDSPMRPFPATYLGSSEVTLMELTTAFTLFPNLGTRPEKPFIIDRIETKEGKVVYQGRTPSKRVLRPTTAYEIHSCLSEVLERGTAEKTYTELGLKRFPLGGKTGTAYNFTDTWFEGYSSAVTCGVWVGLDRPETIMPRGYGAALALPIWADVMKAASPQRYPANDFSPPVPLRRVTVCSVSNELATSGCDRAGTAYGIDLPEGRQPREACSVHRGGVLAGGNARDDRQKRSVPQSIFRSFKKFFGGD